MRWYKSLFVFSLIFILGACGTLQASVETSVPTTQATAVPSLATATPLLPTTGSTPTLTSPAATNTSEPTASPEPTNAPSATPAVTATAVAGGAPPDYSADTYLDDRSTPTGLVLSYYNAINRHEYLRAYSYWQDQTQLPSFDQFAQGYQDTASVEVSLGAMGLSVGAGQTYYTVPVLLKSKSTNGDQQTFSGCYTMHLGMPSAQAVPPYQGLGFQTADVQQAASGANDSDLLAHACDATDQQHGVDVMPQNPHTDTSVITATNYLDDRSDPVLVLRSLFNAINRHEYLRAYSYWQNPGASGNLPSFDQFQKGYENTASVDLTTGTVTPDAAAGQIYYSVPAVLKSETTDGKQQTFAGCYTLHLAQPAIQATPPFEPLGIRSGDLSQVANDSNTADLLANACSQSAASGQQPTPQGTRLQMAPGATNLNINGSLSQGGRTDYLLQAASGQYMMVGLNTAGKDLSLEIQEPDGSLLLPASQKKTSWQGTLPASGSYVLSAISSGAGATYNLDLTIPVRVTFKPGAVSASLDGQVGALDINTYLLRALKGQTMTVTVDSPNNDLYLTIYGLDDGQPYVRSMMHQTSFSFELPSTQDYTIEVVSDHATTEKYSLEFNVK